MRLSKNSIATSQPRSAPTSVFLHTFQSSFDPKKGSVDSLDNPPANSFAIAHPVHRPYFDVYHNFLSTPNHFSTPDLTLHVIGRRLQLGKITLKLDDCTNQRCTPPNKMQGSMTTLNPAWCRHRERRYFMNSNQLRRQIHPDRPEGTRPCLQEKYIRSAPAHD